MRETLGLSNRKALIMTQDSHDHGSLAAEEEGYEGPDVEMPLGEDQPDPSESKADATSADSADGEEKSDGLGQDGTIPDEPDGVAAGHTGEPSSFEPEEDERAQA